jgi:PhnB protein
MQLNPYLSFKGDCEAAFKFYEKCLSGKIVAMVRTKETPMKDQASPEWQDKIMHARMLVGDSVLMGADPPPPHYEAAKGFSVTIGIDDPAEAERAFKALSEGGTIRMPFQKTFWALGFGMLTDKFGIPWMINCERAAG